MLKKQMRKHLDRREVSFFLTMNLPALEAAEKTEIKFK